MRKFFVLITLLIASHPASACSPAYSSCVAGASDLWDECHDACYSSYDYCQGQCTTQQCFAACSGGWNNCTSRCDNEFNQRACGCSIYFCGGGGACEWMTVEKEGPL